LLQRGLMRMEAVARAAIIEVQRYDVTLDMTRGASHFRSATTVAFTSAEAGASTFIDLLAAKVHAVRLNGQVLSPDLVYSGTRIELHGLLRHNSLKIVADCEYVNTGDGLHRMTDLDGEIYTYSQFEVSNAHKVYPCFDQPDLKASFALTVIAPPNWSVSSNSPTPDPDLYSSYAVWRFIPTPPIPTYVTAVVAGAYQMVRDTFNCQVTGALIPLGIASRRSVADRLDAKEIFDLTKQGLKYYTSRFGYPFPFIKYDQIFVPDLNYGAMENAGCVTFDDTYLFRPGAASFLREERATTILHELAHMWFGNLVTIRWWDDLWLNEAFASYAAFEALVTSGRWPDPWTAFAGIWKAKAYFQDQLRSAHPVVAHVEGTEDALGHFDSIVYSKGVSAIKQLASWLGQDSFDRGVQQFIEDHAWGNASFEDLLTALEMASGQTLAGWAHDWLHTVGLNTLQTTFDIDPRSRFTSFAVLQTGAQNNPALRSHRMAIGCYRRTHRGLERTSRLIFTVAGNRTDVPSLVGKIQPDVLIPNDGDLTYAKIRLDATSMSVVMRSIGDLSDPMARALCWTMAWDMTRDAEMRARDFLALIEAGIGHEAQARLVQHLLSYSMTAVEDYSDVAWRSEGRRRLESLAIRSLDSVAPGGDLQLVWLRFLADVAHSAKDLDLIGQLLDGTRVLEKLRPDADLRWALLQRLILHGRAGLAEIAAEADRDNSITGHRHAHKLVAAIPTAEAKTVAWDRIVHDVRLPNSTRTAMIAGFHSLPPGGEELIRPFVDEYFKNISEIWASRSAYVSRELLSELYPKRLIEQSVVDRTDELLREFQLPGPVCRILAENRELVARALQAQRADGIG
jgi:aminopeptidase N